MWLVQKCFQQTLDLPLIHTWASVLQHKWPYLEFSLLGRLFWHPRNLGMFQLIHKSETQSYWGGGSKIDYWFSWKKKKNNSHHHPTTHYQIWGSKRYFEITTCKNPWKGNKPPVANPNYSDNKQHARYIASHSTFTTISKHSSIIRRKRL